MRYDFLFFLNSIALGVGLAMDAFSVSLTDGLNEPHMKGGRMALIAGTYGFFQFAMPMIGWVCVRFIAEQFAGFQRFIPWIALLLLLYIGGELLLDGIRTAKKSPEDSPKEFHALAFGKLMVQAVATSIDALSVGFTISAYRADMALVASLIIAVVTFLISFGGLLIGKKVGTKLESKAALLGGIILIAIGIEIWLKGILS